MDFWVLTLEDIVCTFLYLAGCWVQSLFSFSNTFSLQLHKVSLPSYNSRSIVDSIIVFWFLFLTHPCGRQKALFMFTFLRQWPSLVKWIQWSLMAILVGPTSLSGWDCVTLDTFHLRPDSDGVMRQCEHTGAPTQVAIQVNLLLAQEGEAYCSALLSGLQSQMIIWQWGWPGSQQFWPQNDMFGGVTNTITLICGASQSEPTIVYTLCSRQDHRFLLTNFPVDFRNTQCSCSWFRSTEMI